MERKQAWAESRHKGPLSQLVVVVVCVCAIALAIRLVPVLAHIDGTQEVAPWHASEGDGYSVSGIELTMPKELVLNAVGLPFDGRTSREEVLKEDHWNYLDPAQFASYTPVNLSVLFNEGLVRRVIGPSLVQRGKLIGKHGEQAAKIVSTLGLPNSRRGPEPWGYLLLEEWCFPHQGYTLVVYVRVSKETKQTTDIEGFCLESDTGRQH